jgi:hypothetical protein
MTADGLRDALVFEAFSLLDAPEQGEEEAETGRRPRRPR